MCRLGGGGGGVTPMSANFKKVGRAAGTLALIRKFDPKFQPVIHSFYWSWLVMVRVPLRTVWFPGSQKVW